MNQLRAAKSVLRVSTLPFPTVDRGSRPGSRLAAVAAIKRRLGRQFGSTLGPQLCYELRYESLVSHAERECLALCSFLGLPYDNTMLRFHQGKTKAEPGLSAKEARLSVTPGLRDWKSQM